MPQEEIPIKLLTKKGIKRNKKQRAEIYDISDTDEAVENEPICCLQDGNIILGDGESSISVWSFG